jgi:uncharacterized membrane protein
VQEKLYRYPNREFEEDKGALMSSSDIQQKKRHIRMPVLRAVVDAFLLGTLAVLLLTFAGTGLFVHAWLILPIYGAVFLIAFVLRLRQAAHAPQSEDPQDAVSRELSSARSLNAIGIWKGNQHQM